MCVPRIVHRAVRSSFCDCRWKAGNRESGIVSEERVDFPQQNRPLGLGANAAAADRRAFWLFALLAVVMLGAGIGLRDPWPADEPRFALSAKQMVDSGNWLIPHRGSELYADKPPLFMAMQAAAFELTRSWRVAFLLPSLLAALGTLLLVYDLARRLWDHRTG